MARQAALITELNKEVRVLREKLGRAEELADSRRDAAHYYMLIQKACENSPVVAGEFQRFLMTCKLVEEQEGGVPGLTAPVPPSPQYGFDF